MKECQNESQGIYLVLFCLVIVRESFFNREKSKDQRRQLYSKIRGLTDKNWTKEDEIRYCLFRLWNIITCTVGLDRPNAY